MPTEPPSKPLVVLIHGYLDNPTVWRDVASALEANGFHTIAPTLLPGDERELFSTRSPTRSRQRRRER